MIEPMFKRQEHKPSTHNSLWFAVMDKKIILSENMEAVTTQFTQWIKCSYALIRESIFQEKRFVGMSQISLSPPPPHPLTPTCSFVKWPQSSG